MRSPPALPLSCQMLLLAFIAGEAAMQAEESNEKVRKRFQDAIRSAHEHWPKDVESWHDRQANWTEIESEIELVHAEGLIVAPVVHLRGKVKKMRFFLCRRGLVQLETSSTSPLPAFVKEPTNSSEASAQAKRIVQLAIRVLEQETNPFPSE